MKKVISNMFLLKENVKFKMRGKWKRYIDKKEKF